jgi:predicted site-specific integrase-resolvase
MKTIIQNPSEVKIAPQGLLTRGQVAGLFGVCKETIRRWERQGLFKPVIMNARVLRYRPEDVQALIAQNIVVQS